MVRSQLGRLQFVGSFDRQLPPIGLPEVAFAGRSNVGKSSALNRLLNRKRAARVSRTPGRTQRINLFRIGEAAVFADLPGYGFAKVPEAVQASWKGMVEGYLAERDTLRLVIVLVDARRDPQPMDGRMLQALTEVHVPGLVLATKVDKLKRAQRGRQLATIGREFQLPAGQPLPFSAVTGEGIDETWQAIERVCA